jgi:hypothetical protein
MRDRARLAPSNIRSVRRRVLRSEGSHRATARFWSSGAEMNRHHLLSVLVDEPPIEDRRGKPGRAQSRNGDDDQVAAAHEDLFSLAGMISGTVIGRRRPVQPLHPVGPVIHSLAAGGHGVR